MFYLAIAGGRDFTNIQRVEDYVLGFKQGIGERLIIVSGGARGADALAKQVAYKLGFNYVEVPAMWDQHGRGAGFMRNEVMVDMADAVVAFWDGKSKGTAHTIRLATESKTPLKICKYGDES